MQSFKSKLMIGMVKNRHLLKFKLHEDPVTVDTDLVALRKEHDTMVPSLFCLLHLTQQLELNISMTDKES